MSKGQLCTVLILSILAGFAGGILSNRVAIADAPKIIEAEEFRLKGANGSTIGQWNEKYFLISFSKGVFMIGGDKYPKLMMLQPEGIEHKSSPATATQTYSSKVLIEAGEKGAFIRLSDPTGKRSMGMLAFSDRTSAVVQEGETVRAFFGLTSEEAKIGLNDKKGNIRAMLGNISLKTRKSGSTELRPESSLVLFDSKGKVLYSIP